MASQEIKPRRDSLSLCIRKVLQLIKECIMSKQHVVWGVFAADLLYEADYIHRAVEAVLGQGTEARLYFLDYIFEEKLVQTANKPTLVLSNGKTKTRSDLTGSQTIYYSVDAALKKFGHKATVMSPSIFGFYIDWVFRLKLRIYKWSNLLTLALA